MLLRSTFLVFLIDSLADKNGSCSPCFLQVSLLPDNLFDLLSIECSIMIATALLDSATKAEAAVRTGCLFALTAG